jgi:DNA invertase Pin-like site-specific DNA recombinase
MPLVLVSGQRQAVAVGDWQSSGPTRDVLNDATLGRPLPPAGILIGYARCSTEEQDLSAQREILRGLGVTDDRVYLDHGLTGTNRSRPGLNNALAALREGDTLVVPKLDRLARSVPDARAIGDSLAARGVRLSLGGSVYDPSDPMGKCFFNILATFAEFEVDLLRMRTREGMAIARAKGRLKGKAPKLSRTQRTVLLELHGAGEHSIAELAELFSISRATVYRELARPPAKKSVADVR